MNVSKMVSDRLKSSESVLAAGRINEQVVEKKVGELFGNEAGAAARVLLRESMTRLTADTKAMLDADEANARETSDDSHKLVARDESAARVYAEIVELREAASAVHGAAFVGELGFNGPTPKDPTQLNQLVGRVLTTLGSIKVPAPKRPGLSVDLAAFTPGLVEENARLGAALREVADDARRADGTLARKREAMARYDATFSHAANLLSTLLTVAGEDELSRKVRPSTRKPGQTLDEQTAIPPVDPA